MCIRDRPYSGPASSYSVIGHTETAFFNMINDQGGVAGHKINFISLDDGYSPPKTVEDVRQLVEPVSYTHLDVYKRQL